MIHNIKHLFKNKNKTILFAALIALLFLSCANDLSKTDTTVTVTGIVLSPDESGISLVKGTTRQINAHAVPENATDKKLTYTSDNEGVASVTAGGLITAKAVGSAKITIKASNGISKTINVTVTAAHISVTGIVLSPDESGISLVKGTTRQINAHAVPENATDKKLTYTSDNEGVASVTAGGLITAKAVGSAKITIKASNNVSKEITVTVTAAHIPVTGIVIPSGETTIFVGNGGTRQIGAYAVPENATNKTLTYSIDDDSIASVTADGLITAREVGSTTITITAADNPALSKKVTLTVTPATVRVTSIEFEDGQPADPVELIIGEEYKLKLKVIPEDATNKELDIKSSDDDIVWPNGDGNRWIKAYHDVGEATVTITAKDGSGVSTVVHFKTKQKTTDPSISIDNLSVSYGSDEANITVTVKTLNGKLNYTPEVVGGGAKWLRVDGKESAGDNEDTVTLHLKQNKTVWERKAYIKFKDNNTNNYVISAGKELQVELTQKKNENPNVTIKWVYGIEGPTAEEKKPVEIQGSNPPEYHRMPYVFYWYETEHTKFFNTRKMGPTGSNNQGFSDGSQCWAKSSSNMLHWWFEQNKENVEKYMEKKGITKENNPTMYEMYNPYYKRGLPDTDENIKSSIANEFRKKCPNSTNGNWIYSGLRWYLYGLKGLAINTTYSPALFKDVFGKEEGKDPVAAEGTYTKKIFEDILKDALLNPNSKKAVGVHVHDEGKYGHGITLWGAAFDEEENVIAIYVCDNNFQPNRIFTYGIYYKGDIYADDPKGETNVYPYLIDYKINKKINRYVGTLVTLDKGEAQWQKWLNSH
ncbi:IdeS/Mac family cysteine endopeptidase [Treponema sp. SP13]|uniref:IdeS/Mac family cysteine endopeptidase n=1 Tax=Treponema sp. SP13 TaxID=2789742 RepID=UPI003D9044AD